MEILRNEKEIILQLELHRVHVCGYTYYFVEKSSWSLRMICHNKSHAMTSTSALNGINWKSKIWPVCFYFYRITPRPLLEKEGWRTVEPCCWTRSGFQNFIIPEATQWVFYLPCNYPYRRSFSGLPSSSAGYSCCRFWYFLPGDRFCHLLGALLPCWMSVKVTGYDSRRYSG